MTGTASKFDAEGSGTWMHVLALVIANAVCASTPNSG
jgi:hypothetical protein